VIEMSSLHIVVGSGPIGSTVARLLAGEGERVRVVTRRGTGPAHPSIELVAADANDTERLRALATGAVAVYNCVNPPYHRWPIDWPPLAASMLGAAEAAGAVLATTGNLYGYGPVDGPMTEDLPLAATSVKGQVRADMWRNALAAHQAGRVRVTEVRASDYVGPGAKDSLPGQALPRLLAGKSAWLPVPLDVPHSFTSTVDTARLLVTVARDERAWGRAWHVPTGPAVTARELLERMCRIGGLPKARLHEIPWWALWGIGTVWPLVKELREVRYQWAEPFVLDSSGTEKLFDLSPTPLDDVLRETVKASRQAR
jgi:nucleoside-diphosphate-sugar epimerase